MIRSEEDYWRKNLLKHLRDIVFITAVGTLFALQFTWHNLNWNVFFYDLLYAFMIGTTLWKGNELVGWLHEKYFPCERSHGRTLAVSIIRVTVFSILNIFLINWIWISLIQNAHFWPWLISEGGYWTFVIELMVTFIVALTFLVKEYFKAWRASVRNEEKLKREALSMQYEALKNQVNPHFLFNSLNVLTSLVETDTKKSVKFIKQLSEVYRYVLEHKDKELVSIETEMKFVESYIFLQKIRYGNSLKYSKDPGIGKLPDHCKVIPLSIQILVENAIKHNVISEEEPLTIEIALEDNDLLVIRNNLQKRTAVSDSGNIGLNNLRSRYGYLSDKGFEVLEGDGYFIVRLPVLRV